MTATLKALGNWPNAPLALVVAQVRFEPIPENAPNAVAERIQNATDRSHPHVSPLLPISVIIGQPPHGALAPSIPAAGLDLRNPENTEVIRVQPDGLTFMSSAYQDSDHFRAQWLTFMQALCEQREIRVVRLGLRYVDFITPSENHAPEDYFLDGFGRSPSILGEQSPVGFNLYDFTRPDGGQLRIQYGRGYGLPTLPSDLQDSVLLPARFSSLSPSGLSAFLDMDRWLMVNQPMTAANIADGIEQLRLDVSERFRSIMSPLAESEWIDNKTGASPC